MICTAITLFRPKARGLTMSAAVVSVLALHVVHLYITIAYVLHVEAYRKSYPAVSVADRLSYENETPAENHRTRTLSLDPAVEYRLINTEADNPYKIQKWALDLHEENAWEVGLWEVRNGSYSDRWYWRTTDIPGNVSITISAESRQTFNKHNDTTPVPLSESVLTGVHWRARDRFVNPKRMGSFKSREVVYGFAPHQVDQWPNFGEYTGWTMTKMALLSIHRFDEPVAYVSQYAPNMTRLTTAPTQPLNEFEASAVELLRSEQDVVIEQNDHLTRIVGSLRASSDCLTCHSAQRGELLGAFSYELRPSAATR